MSSIRYEINPDAVIVLTLDAPRSPVNLMSESFRHDLHEAVKRVQADLKDRPELLGVIINSAKSSFFAGADLKAMLTIGPSQAASFLSRCKASKLTLGRLKTWQTRCRIDSGICTRWRT